MQGKVSEGTVALGLLTLFAMWLFIGLPFLYLPVKISCENGCTAMLSVNAGFLLSFLGGSVTAYFIGLVHAYYKRPILRVRLEPGRGCYITTSRGNPATHEARFLRLLVENVGKSSIQGCAPYLINIAKVANGTATNVQQEVIALQWSAGGSGQFRTIPRDAFFYVDVASLDFAPNNPSVLAIPLAWSPNHFAALLQTAGTFELTIKIAGENVKPYDKKVTFDFDPTNTDLQFQYDR